MHRYDRQVRVDSFGEAGQARLDAARVAIVGCGALGSRVAEDLARSGVGYLRLVDRDWVEASNLHRQHLYDEADAQNEEPKVLAAAAHLARINSDIEVEPRLEDLRATNVVDILGDVDLVIDGTDNFRTRYLINDFAVREQKPWIYGACVATQAMAAAFLPGQACLRCIFPEAPPTAVTQTCASVGILPPSAAMATTLQTMLAFAVLTRPGEVPRRFFTCDVRDFEVRGFEVPEQPVSTCLACAEARFPALDAALDGEAESLCGRQAVQLTMPLEWSLEELAQRFQEGEPEVRGNMLRVQVPEGRITFFRGGRVIVQGTDDVARARALFDRYLGA